MWSCIQALQEVSFLEMANSVAHLYWDIQNRKEAAIFQLVFGK